MNVAARRAILQSKRCRTILVKITTFILVFIVGVYIREDNPLGLRFLRISGKAVILPRGDATTTFNISNGPSLI